MKTVLHVLNMGSVSGAENVVMTICQYFQTQYRMIYASPDGMIRSVLSEKGIEYEPVKEVSRGEIVRVINKIHPDLIHAHDFTASTISAISAHKIPVISHIHNNSPWLKSVNLRTISYGLSCMKFKKMLGVSDSVFDDFIFGKRFQKKEMIIGNPVNVQTIRERITEAENQTGYDIVYLGRLSEAKDPERFLHIMKAIVCRLPDVQAVMIGDGELREKVETIYHELELEKNVKMIGFQSNPFGILKNSKVMCMPSKWEGYGLAAVESLACGLPVVCSAAGGLPGIVTEDAGKICTADDEFITEIITLLTDESLRQKKASAAMERANTLDNLNEYMGKLRKVYTEIMGMDGE